MDRVTGRGLNNSMDSSNEETRNIDKIVLENWEYTCGDGCCTESYTDIIINGEKITTVYAYDFTSIIVEIMKHYLIHGEVEVSYRE